MHWLQFRKYIYIYFSLSGFGRNGFIVPFLHDPLHVVSKQINNKIFLLTTIDV